jgi:hypothetical protein
MAPLRHPGSRMACLLTGEDRKWPVHGQNVANDPYLTLAITATSAGLAGLAPAFFLSGSIYLSSQTSSMRQLL